MTAGVVTVMGGISRIVTIKHSGGAVEIRQALSPRLSVISMGVQGPVGNLAESVLQRALQAEVDSRAALQSATATDAALSALLADLSSAFTYHAGAIAAQGG